MKELSKRDFRDLSTKEVPISVYFLKAELVFQDTNYGTKMLNPVLVMSFRKK